MANRAMAAKVERAKRQARELASMEYSKAFYQGNTTLAQANHARAETDALVEKFISNGGTITACSVEACNDRAWQRRNARRKGNKSSGQGVFLAAGIGANHRMKSAVVYEPPRGGEQWLVRR